MRVDASIPRAPGAPASGGMPYPRFLAEALAILAVLAAVGYLPTLKLGGESAIPAMLAGCGLSLVASLVGTVPLVTARDPGPERLIPMFLGALALRLTAAIVLGVAAALSGLFAVAPLLVWMLVSHLGLLVADTRFALSFSRQPDTLSLDPVLEKR